MTGVLYRKHNKGASGGPAGTAVSGNHLPPPPDQTQHVKQQQITLLALRLRLRARTRLPAQTKPSTLSQVLSAVAGRFSLQR